MRALQPIRFFIIILFFEFPAVLLFRWCGIKLAQYDGADNTDDASAHADGDEHDSDSNDDLEPNAYLEVEPKEALFLVDMSLFSFTPNVLQVRVGDVVELASQNSEADLHDFTMLVVPPSRVETNAKVLPSGDSAPWSSKLGLSVRRSSPEPSGWIR